MRAEIKNNLKNKAKTEKDKETVKPTVINDSLIKYGYLAPKINLLYIIGTT